jgi:RHS repeat-associated protein
VSPTGNVTRYTWSADKLTQTNDSTAGKTVNIEYETSYSLPKHIYGSVAEQWLTYDQTKTGWPLKTVKVGSSTAPVTTYVTDAFGRPTSITDPGNHTTSFGYQSTGLRNSTSVTTPSGQTTSYGRDALGRVVSVTDPNLHTSSTGLDVLNRPTWTAGPVAGDTTRFQYDLLNHITAVTDAKGQVYTSVPNALGWVTAQTDPASRADTMKYDIAGNVVYSRSRAGRAVRLEYDVLNRVTKKIGLGGADSITYAYDSNGRWAAARTVSRGVLVSTDTIYSDSIGRTTREVTIRPGAGTWSVVSSYDATKSGRTESMLYTGVNATRWIDFWYDAAQRPSQLRLYSGNSVFGYNSDDQLQTVQFPSGLTEYRSFAWTHAPSLRTYSVTGVDTVLSRWYTSDSLARITERGGSGAKFQRFVYDATDRLNGWYKRTKTNQPACTDGGPYGYTCSGTLSTTDTVWAMGYDKVGNPTDLSGTVDPGNRLRTYNGFTMTYDDDGNLLSKSAGGVTDTYDWDDFGQLKWVKRNGVLRASFDYDGFGRRIRKASATYGVIRYIWDGMQITAEADSTGNVTQTYAYYPGIDQLHSVTNASGQTYLASSEPLGDVNGLIRSSDNAIVARYAYRPWGELETDSVMVAGARLNSLRWRGLPYDAETGLYHMRARYYDPQTRRFISEDPIALGGGINQYAFANGDPVNGADPFGLDARKCEQLMSYSTGDWEEWRWEEAPCSGGGGSAPASNPPDPNAPVFPDLPNPPTVAPKGPGGAGGSTPPNPIATASQECIAATHELAMQALSDAFTIGSTLVGGYGLIKGGVQLIGTVAYSVERQAAIQAMRGGGTAAASAYYKGAGRNLILDATIFSHTVTTQSRAEAVLRWLPGPATYYKWQDQMKACAK